MTGSIEQSLASLGIKMPSVAPAVANYVPFTRRGALITISGQLPRTDDGLITGTLGNGTSIDRGVAAAQQCAVAILAILNEAIEGDLGRLDGCVQLSGFVQSAPGFTEHSTVINGASDLIATVLGERGRHARAAVGVSSLPFGVAVEVSAQFMLRA
ncbi:MULTISPECIES: RidA family protein [Sphingomonadales]|uniref:RidA family protein n=1 Tax=Sphingomonadales TaxID=204457 RepID=UPI0009BFD5D8|nr:MULTISPECIES: RidA family protein [Sphingomonadales]